MKAEIDGKQTILLYGVRHGWIQDPEPYEASDVRIKPVAAAIVVAVASVMFGLARVAIIAGEQGDVQTVKILGLMVGFSPVFSMILFPLVVKNERKIHSLSGPHLRVYRGGQAAFGSHCEVNIEEGWLRIETPKYTIKLAGNDLERCHVLAEGGVMIRLTRLEKLPAQGVYIKLGDRDKQRDQQFISEINSRVRPQTRGSIRPPLYGANRAFTRAALIKISVFGFVAGIALGGLVAVLPTSKPIGVGEFIGFGVATMLMAGMIGLSPLLHRLERDSVLRKHGHAA